MNSEEKDYKFTGYNSGLKDISKVLRKEMTPSERKLWYRFLKDYKVKFYRQRSIERYTADFYCSTAKLVVELDGAHHYTPEGIEYDELRTSIINLHGVEVLRFTNDEIAYNFENVCNAIDVAVKKRIYELSNHETI